MKKSLSLLLVLTGILSGFSQNPEILWQKTIGGNDIDLVNAFEATSDGGYIIGGYSKSDISGEKTENSRGGTDIWIVKIDDSGNIMWQKTYGGSGEDSMFSIKQTSDGGYIVGAASDSNISGDKTENSRGGLDYWILKLNSSGEIVWQKTYGGAQPEFYAYVVQTTDGGYFVGGYSESDVSGDKTDPTKGQRDFWVLKLDSSGEIVWQKSIGGSLLELLTAAFQTADGGFLVGGYSSSGISGDKTENNRGETDNWIVKLDPSGNVTWDKTYGGNASDVPRDIIQTADGGYLVGGYSKSNISGDKTENSRGDYDYWVLKLGSNGDLVWQKTIGGSAIDYPRNVVQLNDGNYLIAGWSYSNISGEKTQNSQGASDYWLVKLDVSGNILSQNSIGGSEYESGTYIIEASDGNFVMTCSSDSNISGDKTENSRGLDDYWVFKTTPDILGVPVTSLGSSISIYPNPTNNNFTIDLGREYFDVNVQILNTLGQIITSETYTSAKTIEQEINTSAGIYFVKVSTVKEGSITIRIIKQ